MKERFTRFRKRALIKMWRTLKAESGYRMTKCTISRGDCTLRELMDQHESRVMETAAERLKEQGK